MCVVCRGQVIREMFNMILRRLIRWASGLSMSLLVMNQFDESIIQLAHFGSLGRPIGNFDRLMVVTFNFHLYPTAVIGTFHVICDGFDVVYIEYFSIGHYLCKERARTDNELIVIEFKVIIDTGRTTERYMQVVNRRSHFILLSRFPP